MLVCLRQLYARTMGFRGRFRLLLNVCPSDPVVNLYLEEG